MRSFHRGFRSFRRNYARNIVVVVLLFVCLTFSMSMLAVKLAADNQVNTIKQEVGNYGEIEISSAYQLKQFQAERTKTAAERQAEARSMSTAPALGLRRAARTPCPRRQRSSPPIRRISPLHRSFPPRRAVR